MIEQSNTSHDSRAGVMNPSMRESRVNMISGIVKSAGHRTTIIYCDIQQGPSHSDLKRRPETRLLSHRLNEVEKINSASQGTRAHQRASLELAQLSSLIGICP